MYNKDFAEKLKFAREDCGMNQEQVAEKLKISRTVISRYENGKLEPSIETLCKLIDLYEINANWLLGTGIKKTTD